MFSIVGISHYIVLHAAKGCIFDLMQEYQLSKLSFYMAQQNSYSYGLNL